MKKLYRRGTVHPSPPAISDQLAFLPATILTLTAALSPEDREVLAYLISSPPFTNFSGRNTRRSTHQKNNPAKGAAADGGGDHPPLFTCSCFRCYMSYWIRWDSSPNRQLIHEIIDAFEDWLAKSGKNNGGKSNNRKEKKNKRDSSEKSGETKRSESMSLGNSESAESESVAESSSAAGGEGSGEDSGGGGGGGGGGEEEEKGSVRRFVSFIGERIWGAWGN